MSASFDIPPPPTGYPSEASQEQQPEVVWVGEGRQLGQDKNCYYYGARVGGRMILVGDVVLLRSVDVAAPFIAWVEQLLETPDGSKLLRTRWFYRRSECEQWGIAVPPSLEEDQSNEVFLTDQVDDNVVASTVGSCTVVLPDLGVRLQPAAASSETFRCTHLFQTSPRPSFARLKPLIALEPILKQRAQREVLWAEQHVRRPPGGEEPGTESRKRPRVAMEDDSVDASKRRRVDDGGVVEWQHVWTIGEPLETTLPPGSLTSRGYLLDLIDRLEAERGAVMPSESEKADQPESGTHASPGIAAPMMRSKQSPEKHADAAEDDTRNSNNQGTSLEKGGSRPTPLVASAVAASAPPTHPEHTQAALPKALARVSPHLHQTRRQDVRMGVEHQSDSPAQLGQPGTAAEIPIPSGEVPSSAATAPVDEIPIGGLPVDPERDFLTGNDDPWTVEQETAFAISYTRLGKQYGRIASNIPGKNVHDVIAYYFHNKKRHFEPEGQARRAELARQAIRRQGADTTADMSSWLMDDDAMRAQELHNSGASDLHRHALAAPPPPQETLDSKWATSSVDGFSVPESVSEEEAADAGFEQEQQHQEQLARDSNRRTGVPGNHRQAPLGARLARRAVRRPGQWWVAPDLAVCSLCHETYEPVRLLWCAVPTCRRTVCPRCYRIDALAYKTRESKTTWTGAKQNAFWCCLDCCPPPPEALLPPGPEDLFLHGEEDEESLWQREDNSSWIGWHRALDHPSSSPAVPGAPEIEARNLLHTRSDPASVGPEAVAAAIQEDNGGRKVGQRIGRWSFTKGSDWDSVAAALQAFSSGVEGIGTDHMPQGVAVPRRDEAAPVASSGAAAGEAGTPGVPDAHQETASSFPSAADSAGRPETPATESDWETLQQSRGRRRRRAAELADMGRLALAIQEGRRRVGTAAVVETQAQRSLRLAQRELVRASHISVHDALLFLRAVELRYGTSRRMRKFVQALTAYREGKWTARDFARRCLRLFRDDADLQRAVLVFLPVELREVYQWSMDAVQRAAAVEATTIASRVAEAGGFEQDSDSDEPSRNEAQGGSADGGQ